MKFSMMKAAMLAAMTATAWAQGTPAAQPRRMDARALVARSTLVDQGASAKGMHSAGAATVNLELTSALDADGRALGSEHARFATANEAGEYYMYRLQGLGVQSKGLCEPGKGCRMLVRAHNRFVILRIDAEEFRVFSAETGKAALALEEQMMKAK